MTALHLLLAAALACLVAEAYRSWGNPPPGATR